MQVAPPADVQERPGARRRGARRRRAGRARPPGAPRRARASLRAPTTTDDAAEVWVALGGRFLGRIVLRDQPRAEARAALEEMRALGIDRLVLLTGDRAGIAREVGDALGMDEVVAEVLPAQKLEVVRAEQAAGRTVMMVGDGVNDALALAGADVGVAIGAEVNEVALGGADVALLGADLGRLPRLVRLADTTRRVIGQNVWLAFGFAAVADRPGGDGRARSADRRAGAERGRDRRRGEQRADPRASHARRVGARRTWQPLRLLPPGSPTWPTARTLRLLTIEAADFGYEGRAVVHRASLEVRAERVRRRCSARTAAARPR